MLSGVGVDLDFYSPVQACREAQGEPGKGVRLSERSEFAPRRLSRASQGTRRASMSGVFSFGYFSLDKQRKVTRTKSAKHVAKFKKKIKKQHGWIKLAEP